jgi:hypothetical protein
MKRTLLMKIKHIERRRVGMIALAVVMTLAMVAACQSPTVTVTHEVTRQVEVTVLVTQQVGPQPSLTPKQPSTPAPASMANAPFPDAPLCPDTGEAHDHSQFHTLWDDKRGCHYDHEHGQNPFTPEVAAAFPGFDLKALLGGVGLGHTNPSGPMENTHKHGGFKWQVLLTTRMAAGHEGSPIGVDASVIQYHAFGDYSVEFRSRVLAGRLLRQCLTDNPTDYGYIYLVQHVDYGQRVSGYQELSCHTRMSRSPLINLGRLLTSR